MNATESAACQGFLLLVILAPAVGCAGKKIDSPTVGPVTVQLSPSSAAVNPDATQQFTATVLGSSNQGVTWAVDSAGPGNSTTGAVTATGLYTAPALAGKHTVTATIIVLPIPRRAPLRRLPYRGPSRSPPAPWL